MSFQSSPAPCSDCALFERRNGLTHCGQAASTLSETVIKDCVSKKWKVQKAVLEYEKET